MKFHARARNVSATSLHYKPSFCGCVDDDDGGGKTRYNNEMKKKKKKKIAVVQLRLTSMTADIQGLMVGRASPIISHAHGCIYLIYIYMYTYVYTQTHSSVYTYIRTCGVQCRELDDWTRSSALGRNYGISRRHCARVGLSIEPMLGRVYVHKVTGGRLVLCSRTLA